MSLGWGAHAAPPAAKHRFTVTQANGTQTRLNILENGDIEIKNRRVRGRFGLESPARQAVNIDGQIFLWLANDQLARIDVRAAELASPFQSWPGYALTLATGYILSGYGVRKAVYVGIGGGLVVYVTHLFRSRKTKFVDNLAPSLTTTENMLLVKEGVYQDNVLKDLIVVGATFEPTPLSTLLKHQQTCADFVFSQLPTLREVPLRASEATATPDDDLWDTPNEETP